jgi:ankyrin repeat protein
MNPLLEAILIGSDDEVRRLLQTILLNRQNNLLGQSTLHLAVSRPQHLELLLASGADVNARDRHGLTPLMYATATGSSSVAKNLFIAGANPFFEILFTIELP